MKNTKRILLAAVAALLLVAVSVGGTMAWLVAKTNPVTNTFTVGDINITLTETTGGTYKIVPGVNLDKNPKVTVKAGSEACWVFVKVDEESWPATDKVSYSVDNTVWSKLEGYDNVWYKQQDAVSADTELNVLTGQKVYVSEELTKAEANAIGSPKLTFTAYAIQQEGFSTAADAWKQIGKETFDSTGANIVVVNP